MISMTWFLTSSSWGLLVLSFFLFTFTGGRGPFIKLLIGDWDCDLSRHECDFGIEFVALYGSIFDFLLCSMALLFHRPIGLLDKLLLAWSREICDEFGSANDCQNLVCLTFFYFCFISLRAETWLYLSFISSTEAFFGDFLTDFYFGLSNLLLRSEHSFLRSSTSVRSYWIIYDWRDI